MRTFHARIYISAYKLQSRAQLALIKCNYTQAGPHSTNLYRDN